MLGAERLPPSGEPGTYCYIYAQNCVDLPSDSLQRTSLFMFNSKGQEQHWECCSAWCGAFQAGALWTLLPQGFPWGAQGGVWPVALLPVEASNYARWDGWSVVLASPGSKVDQKAWVLFSSLTFAIVQYWQGFP